MAKPERRLPVGEFLLIAASLIIVIAGLRAASALLVPFLLSAFIAIVCLPPLFWLRRRGLAQGLAVSLVVLGMAGITLAIAAFIGTSLNDFSRDLPSYQARLQEQSAALLQWLHGLGIDMPAPLLDDYLDPAAVMQLVGNTLAGIGGLLTNGFLILLSVIFILLEAAALPDKLRAALGDATASLRRFETFADGVQRYLAIKTSVSLLTGICVAAWLAVMGVDYAPLWGLLAFLLNYVPNIGSIIAAAPAMLLALVQFGPGQALVAGLGYLLVNVLVGNVIEPRFMGRGLGLSTLVVFLSLVFWGWVLGPVGMLLSVPLTMIVKIGLESSEGTRWIAVLIDSHAPPPATAEPSPLPPAQ